MERQFRIRRVSDAMEEVFKNVYTGAIGVRGALVECKADDCEKKTSHPSGHCCLGHWMSPKTRGVSGPREF